VCTLIAFWRSVPGYDIALGMNRDESSMRPADPPAVLDGTPVIIAPRDRQAGGTWLGASGTGLVVALSNRRGATSPSARSRGQLVLDALRQPSVSGVDVFRQREIREHEYNYWNLLAASGKELRFFRYEGELAMNRGHEGLNVLTNEGGNVVTDPKVQFIQGLLAKTPSRSIDEVIRSLQGALRTHASGAGGVGLCVHFAGGGTVSSTIMALINYVSPEVMGFTEDVNRFVGEFAKEDRKRLIPFGSVHPKRTKDPKRDVERLASKWEMGGMKIHPPHQLFAANAYADGKVPALRMIYKTAERLKMPVMVHTGTSVFPGARSKFGDPMALDDVAQDFPDLTILMAHGGRPLWCDTAFYLLRRHRNLHLGISGIPSQRLREWFPRLEEISAKVVFGSDWPAPGVPGIREEIEGLRSLALSERTKERILSENAAALVK